uniref:Uncharacterized protein n=1 Tax=uncultured marine virus TaxID=186617 RepID=A0A0F7L5U9_9VIRU|nr:hypothetical protein [uncultured marine virus]
MPKTFTANGFQGGLSLVDPLSMEDNQLEVCNNMFYNSDRRLQTRRGYTQFGSTISSDIVTLNTADSATDWTASGDASNLTLDTTNEKRGTGCLNFDVDAYSTGQAVLTLAASGTIDIVDEKGTLNFWFQAPTDYDTLLTDIKVRIGSDSSNYYEWTMTNPTEATWELISLAYTDATTTGTAVDASIDYFAIIVNTASGYAGYTDWLVDTIKSYSSTSNKPATSLYFFVRGGKH